MLNGGRLLPEFYQAWANYYVKFIDSYQKKDSCLGLTVQNEPMAKQTWESCIYTAEEERDFVKLFPTLKNAGLGDKKITVWDHNRDLLSQRASWTTHKLVNTSGELVFIGMKAGVVEIQCLIMLVKFTKCILIKLAFTEGCVEKFDYLSSVGQTGSVMENP
jgi:glucosylceramidase